MKRIIVLCVLVVFAALPAFAECPAADKRAIEDFDRAWGAAAIRGDRSELESIFATDYMNLSAAGAQNKTQTVDATVRDAERARKSGEQSKLTHDYYMIHCTPSTATISHRNTAVTMRDGKEHTTYSRSVHVLEKRAGKWQVVSNASHPLNDAAMIMYMEHDWSDADRKGDLAWFERNLASDYSGISSRTGKQLTKSEELDEMRNRKTTVTGAEALNMNVRMVGDDTGVVTGTYRMQGREQDGKPFDRRIAYTDVWVKRDGRWQALASQGTLIANP